MPSKQWDSLLQKFVNRGVQTALPGDLVQEGKYRKLLNVRGRTLGTISPRPGTPHWSAFGSPFNGRDFHTIRKFFNVIGVDVLLAVLQEEVGLFFQNTGYAGTPGEFGRWTGNPCSVVVDNPEDFPDAFAYVFDSRRNRKISQANISYPVGINPPGYNGAATFDQPYDLTPAGALTASINGAGNLTGAYIWKYRYYSTITGARSNFSDISNELLVDANQVDLNGFQTANDPQANRIEIFRLGGVLQTFTLVDVVVNGTATYTDNLSDLDIINNPTEDDFERDKPWAVIDSNGFGVGGYPLPFVWGPFTGRNLACGDPFRRGYLYWTNNEDPDSADRANNLKVTEADEPLVNGLIYDDRSFVFTNDRLMAIYPNIGGFTTFTVLPTPCHRGLFSPWAFAVGDEIYFLSRDGIYATNGGPARSLTADIYNLFPHEDAAHEPQAVNGIVPPEMSPGFDSGLYRLSYADNFLYFDYLGKDLEMHTLVYDVEAEGWSQDEYAAPVRLHYEIPGEKAFVIGTDHVQKSTGVLLATRDGGLLRFIHGQLDSNDGSPANVPFDCAVHTPLITAGNDRTQKLFGDVPVELDRETVTIDITPVGDNGDEVDATTSVDSGSGRQVKIIDVAHPDGMLARNFGLNIDWTIDTTNLSRRGPFLYSWAPSFIVKPDETVKRFIEWHPLGDGLTDAYIWGLEMWIDTEGRDVVFSIYADQAFTGQNFTANANGEKRLRFAWPGAVFKASLMKCLPISGNVNNWRLTRWLWLADEEPPRVPDWDSNWKPVIGDCDVAYVTGYKIAADTFGAAKSLILQTEFEGTITTHTPREGNVINHNGHKTFHFTFDEPFRASLARMHTTDGVLIQVYSECWIAHPEPKFLANWDAVFEDFSVNHIIKGIDIFADTLGQAVTVEILLENVLYQTITVDHDGRIARSYNLNVDGNGEYPRARSVRAMPRSNFKGFLYKARWIADPEPERIANWNPVWTEDNHPGLKFFQGIKVTCDTQGEDKQVLVDLDNGATIGPFTFNCTRRDTIPLSFDNPVLTHSFRLRATDDNANWLYHVDWVWEPAPDEGTVWETQETTYDLPGYFHHKDAYVALISVADVTWTLYHDGVADPYTIPSTGGLYGRVYIPLRANKEKITKHRLESASAFQLFVKDTVVNVKGWGLGGPYQQMRPFGDVHRAMGARL